MEKVVEQDADGAAAGNAAVRKGSKDSSGKKGGSKEKVKSATSL